jgi:ligand-binding sensor domain-containing protein
MDAGGNLWFGTAGNGVILDSVDKNKWIHFSFPDTAINSANNTIKSIAFDKLGNGWFATVGSGVLYYNVTKKTIDTTNTYIDTIITNKTDTSYKTTYRIVDTVFWKDFTHANKRLINDTVWSIAVDGTGNIWFNTSGGLAERKYNDTTTWFNYTKGLTCDSAWSIALVQNNFYLGTLGKGIFKFNGSSFSPITIPYNILGNYVFASAVDSLNNIWFGTPSGVLEYDVSLNQWNLYTTSNGLVNNSVFAVAIDHQGNKWFGTSNGVSKFDGKNWTTYNTSNGLLGNSINAILADNQDNIWFGTQNGISELVNGK